MILTPDCLVSLLSLCNSLSLTCSDQITSPYGVNNEANTHFCCSCYLNACVLYSSPTALILLLPLAPNAQHIEINRKKSHVHFPLTNDSSRDYLVDQLDSIVPLQRLDCHSSSIDQLGQVYGLGRVDSSQIDQVLQSLQRQRLVLRTAAGEEHRNMLSVPGEEMTAGRSK